MKRIIVVIMMLAFSASLFARPQIGIAVYGGFDWGIGERVGDERIVRPSHDTSMPIYGSWGQGTQPGIDVNIGIKRGLSVYVGSGYHIGVSKTTSSTDDNQNWSAQNSKTGNAITRYWTDRTSQNYTQNGINPIHAAGYEQTSVKAGWIPIKFGLKFRAGKQRIKPLFGAGLTLALAGKSTETSIIRVSEANTDVGDDKKVYINKYRPGIGFHGEVGLSVGLTDKISLDLGLTGQILSMKRKTRQLTEWEYKGVNQLNNLDQNSQFDQDYEQKTVYQDHSVADSSDEAAQKNGYEQAQEVTDNFHNLGAKIAITIMF